MAGQRELGDLTPIRRALTELREREQQERRWHGDGAVGAHVLNAAGSLIEDALTKAASTPKELTLEEYAEQQGISVEAARKRWRRRTIPGAYLDASGKVLIPMSTAA